MFWPDKFQENMICSYISKKPPTSHDKDELEEAGQAVKSGGKMPECDDETFSNHPILPENPTVAYQIPNKHWLYSCNNKGSSYIINDLRNKPYKEKQVATPDNPSCIQGNKPEILDINSVITEAVHESADIDEPQGKDIYPIGLQPNEKTIEPKIHVNPVLVPEDSNLATPYINIQLPDSTGNLQNYVLVPAKTEPSAVTMNNHTTETKNKKRFRHLYNSVQLSTLENEFRSSKCISRERKMQLAQELNITPKQIKTWFQNRRTKSRKQLSLNNTSSPGTLTSRSSSSSGPSPCSVTDEETDVTLHLDSMGHNCYKVEIENPQIQKGTDILSKSQSKGPQVTSRSTGLQEKEVLPSCAYHYSPNDAFHGRFDVYGIQDFQRSIPSKANQFIGQLSQQRAWQDPNFEQPPRPFNQFGFSQRIPSNKIIPSHGHIEYSANQMRSQYSADFANSIYDKNYSAPQSMFLPQMQLTGNMYSMPVRDYPYCPETVWPMAQARVKNEDICGTIQQI